MTWLKQSTVVTVQLGAFLDATDGVVPETGLATNMDNATTGIRVSKNGAAMIDRNSATVPAHDDDGHYRIALSATDTNTLGTLRIQYEESGVCTPAWRDFMVVPVNVWDSFFGADLLDIQVAAFDANVLVAGAINAGALNGKGDWNIGKSGYALTVADWNVGKTGYSLTQAFPSNFGSMSITAGGLVDITQVAADKVWATAARILTASTNFNDISEANVLTQVNAAIDTVISELGVAVPAVTPTIRTAIMLMYMTLRNQFKTQTLATDAVEVYNDAGTLITKKLITDDGSDYVEAKMS